MAWVAGVLWAAMLGAAAAHGQGGGERIHYVEREFRLPVGAAGLDVVEVRVESPTPRPLALLTHGTAAEPEQRAHVMPWAQLEQAIWFARRGYVALIVVRQGYGRSSGRPDTAEGGCGSRGSFHDAGQASADDLRAAAKYMAGQPEVDASQVVSVGVSTGGFAQVALAANPMPGLKAAISFAGGRGGNGKGDNCNLDGLLSAFHDFGKHDRVPMLWLYAENDKWFPPKMSAEFDKVYRAAGGRDEFVMVPPDGEDGHGYYRHVSAWSDRVESFLKAQSLLPLSAPLPPPPVPDVPAPAGLSERGQEAFTRFLEAGPYKAFATDGGHGWGSSTGQFTQDLADKQAVENCVKGTKGMGKCAVVARSGGGAAKH
jgi:dienelactone hydrolase